MKNVIGLAALSLFVGDVWAHYIFDQLSIGSTTYPVYQYIRKNTNYNSPVTDLTSDDLRCNVGGESGATTQTVAVKAGDQFTFTLNTPVYHDGPVSMCVGTQLGKGSWSGRLMSTDTCQKHRATFQTTMGAGHGSRSRTGVRFHHNTRRRKTELIITGPIFTNGQATWDLKGT